MNNLKALIPANWQIPLKEAIAADSFQALELFLEDEWKNEQIFPPKSSVFEALTLTPFDQVKVVILGQDPYHGEGQAHGLAFSVSPNVKIPPSLRNIFKELNSDLGIIPPLDGYLVDWAKQGVLMINTVLTVRKGQAHSHKNQGWELFTDEIIKVISEKKDNVIFILWGGPAQKKKTLIASHHHIISDPHPSPLSAYRGFFGSKPFSKVNKILKDLEKEPIEWSIKSESTLF